MTGVLVVAADAFNGVRVVENTVRLFVLLIGIPLALVCVKFGIQSLRKGQPDRAWGTLSYGMIVLSPAVARAMNFGQPINWVTTGILLVGLLAGVIALVYRARWEGWWTKLGRRIRARRDRRRQEKTDG